MKQTTNNLATLGEFGFISRIAASVKSGIGVVTGIGDDCAVTTLTPGMQLLTSTDMLLEDVHFRRSWHDPYRLGRKSLAVNISDIAAMGGIPRWATLSLAVPAGLPLDFLDDFTCGFLAMAEEQGVSLVGGDTCSSKSGLVISVTIIGEQLPDLILRRSGALPGDDIWVTGTLGDAALGLAMLEKADSQNLPHPPPDLPLEGGGVKQTNTKNVEYSSPPFQGEGQGGDGVGIYGACNSLTHPPTPSRQGRGSEYLISRLLDPSPRTAVGLALAESGLVSSMIDISDGLLGDFAHIAEQSGVGGTIRLDDLPISEPFRAAVSHHPDFPYHLALSGGEDYELCFTAPESHRKKIAQIMKKCGIKAVPVGIVTTLRGLRIITGDGTEYQPKSEGFNHFT